MPEPTMPTILSDDDAKKVAEQLITLLTPKSDEPIQQEETSINHEILDGDPSAKAFHDTEAKLIAQLANPKLITVMNRGRSRVHNLTENALNALHDLGRNRKIFKERIWLLT